jgi:hypothetical protein
MPVSTAQTVDVAQSLAGLLGGVGGLRTYWFVADSTRPPAAVIGQPDIDYTDGGAGFCRATWLFPVTVITARSNDRDAQVEMSRLLHDIVNALDVGTDDVFSVEPQSARPIPVVVGGQELPGYLLTVKVRA